MRAHRYDFKHCAVDGSRHTFWVIAASAQAAENIALDLYGLALYLRVRRVS